MADKTDAIYCGTAKQFSEFGTNIRIYLDDIPKEHIKKDNNGKTVIHLTMNKLREPKENRTHSIRVDTYEPPVKNGGGN